MIQMALVIQMVSFKMIIKMDIEINLIYDRKLQIKNYKIYKISNKITKFTNLLLVLYRRLQNFSN